MTNITEFNMAAIARDLARRPEIRHLAKVLQMIGTAGPTGDVDPAPIYIMQAYKLIEKPELAALLMSTIAVCKK